MDSNSGRWLKLEGRWRRNKESKNYRYRATRFLHANKSLFLTSALFVAMLLLLFGIVSRLPPPASATATGGSSTEIDYSAFVQQVKAANVLAVNIQGKTIDALLARPLTQSASNSGATATTASTLAQNELVIRAWYHYISSGDTTTNAPATKSVIDPGRYISTLTPTSSIANLLPLLAQYHVTIVTRPPLQLPIWLSLLWRFLPIFLVVLLMLLMLMPKKTPRSTRMMDDRMTQFARSRTRRAEHTKERAVAAQPGGLPQQAATKPQSNLSLVPPVTFADVAGIDEVRAELEEIVQFLRNPQFYSRLGARIPRGALLVGPPGTGKTLLAKAVAGEAGVAFFSISASEFVEMFVGVGASRVRDLFNQARKSAPSVIFIDELDAVGRKRSIRMSGNDERDQTLNQLLVELDGFNGRNTVVVMAATNRVDILDSALLRPGRFDRHITVSLPDRVGREAILRVHTRNTPLHEEVSLERLARLTTGMSGADLAHLVNEAALVAARKEMETVAHDCFEDALARVQLGALRPLVLSESDRRITAYHEAGHALVAYHSPQADSVNCVTILPRGQSLGVTQFTAEEDRYNYSRETLMARIAVGLGGRVAEELTFGPAAVTTGAENDFQVVTDLARRMVTRWGMSEHVGPIYADNSSADSMALSARRATFKTQRLPSYSLVADANGRLLPNGVIPLDQQAAMQMSAPAVYDIGNRGGGIALASLIDFEVQRLIKEGYSTARSLLSEHAAQLTQLAEALVEHEVLNRQQFESLLRA